MRPHICLALLLSVTGPLAAQEAHRERPQLTLGYGQGSGFFVDRFTYRDAATNVVTKGLETWSANVRAHRFFLDAQFGRWPGHRGVTSLVIRSQITPVTLGRLRPGIGVWYSQSADTQELVSGENWAITTRGKHSMIAGVIDLGFGAYDHSHIRVAAMQGSAKAQDWLGISLDGHPTDSPITSEVSARSDFRAIRVGGAIRRWGFSLESTATGVQPLKSSYAIPGHGLGIVTGTASYVSRWHVGVSATRTFIVAQPAAGTQSLQPFYGSWGAGVFLRFPVRVP